jgi:hypothetical protein
MDAATTTGSRKLATIDDVRVLMVLSVAVESDRRRRIRNGATVC